MPLNDRQIKNAKPTGTGKKAKLFDGGGLYLEVTPAGGKIFRLKYRIDGKEKTLTIGKYPAVSLSEARQAAENARRLLSDGQDPAAAKQQEKQERKAAALNTFEALARRWHADNLHRWQPVHAERILADMQKDVFPHIGQIPLAEVSVSDVKNVIAAIVARCQCNRRESSAMDRRGVHLCRHAGDNRPQPRRTATRPLREKDHPPHARPAPRRTGRVLPPPDTGRY